MTDETIGTAPVGDVALRESEQRYRTLLDGSGALVQSVDPEGRFLFVSPRWLETFGYDTSELANITLWQLIHPDSVGHCERLFGEIMAGHSPVSIDACFITREGESVFVEGTATALRRDGVIVATHALLHDVTSQRAAEAEHLLLREQLQQSQKMDAIGQLTGGVAHDFNNFLTAISLSLEAIGTHALEPQMVGENVRIAQGAVGRATELTQRLLAFARKQTLRPRSLDLNEMVDGMVDLLRRTLGATIQVDVRPGDELWSCSVDPSQLESVLLNLALNGSDALPEGGVLTIATGNIADSGEVELRVTDNGVGMSAEVLAMACDPFYTTKDVGHGTGLGLSMAYGFVKQSGGQLLLESELGEGTTVKLRFPRTAGSAAVVSTPEEVEDDPRGAGEVVLLVEDDDVLRELVRRVLIEFGYRPIPAADPQAALELLEGAAASLLLTDVVLPGGMNGADLAAEAQRRQPGLPVLYMSGYSSTELGSLDDGDPSGSVLLEKPFSGSLLARRVRAVLDLNS
jgi:PAS domain S-box-containing protein